MLSTHSLRHIALLLVATHSTFTQAQAQLNPLKYIGCYSSSSGLSFGNTDPFQTDGSCQSWCVNQVNQPVLGLSKGDTCSCGGSVPPNSAKVDDSKCSTPCFGFGEHKCGAAGFYSVYLTGTEDSVPIIGGGSTGSSTGTPKPTASSTTSAGPSIITSFAPGQTITQTASSTPTPTGQPSGGKSNTAGVAAGATVGVLAILALIGAIIFFLRRRRQRASEEESRRTQVSDFMAGARPTIPAMRGPTGPESRFDAEAMAHRRLSDGSIADNEDYSRRILKVTNPDNRH